MLARGLAALLLPYPGEAGLEEASELKYRGGLYVFPTIFESFGSK